MTKNSLPRLGVNIDHIATLRQLRGTPYPDVVLAAKIAELAGADQITAHLREDRRHIQDQDIKNLKRTLNIPLNFEMAATPEMLRIALKTKPEWCCLVPEKRNEVTTEGGLALKKNFKRIATITEKLQKNKIKVSLFVEPSLEAMKLSEKIGALAVELHTGAYCLADQAGKKLQRAAEVKRIQSAGLLAKKLGMHAHAGHGFYYQNVRTVAELLDESGASLVEEYNIGHAIICRAAMVGMEQAVREMVSAIRAP